ncbi:MAG: hypothetical protein OEM02_12720 [Desulfobulbaceae bacterium]|nr:hypothetical protein [Desulfobulbaceae bacterium]
MIELKIVPTVSPMTVGTIIKKNELKPPLSKYWKIPPDQNAYFVAAIEDILEVYAWTPKTPGCTERSPCFCEKTDWNKCTK